MTSAKQALLESLRSRLSDEIATMRRLAIDAAEAVGHEDNRPESDKDMRSTEASYIARGQAARVIDLERDLNLLAAVSGRDLGPDDPISAGALVSVEQQGKPATYLLVPAAGGVRLSAAGVDAQTLSVRSPLGAALLGLREGDEAELASPQGRRVVEITEVR
jgi:transcription elongation GreA/GreB family factor